MITGAAVLTPTKENIPSGRPGQPTTRKTALCVVLTSLLFWTGWICLNRDAHPFGDISNGKYCDHVTHMNCARVFPRVGLDIWRKPISEMFPELNTEQKAQLPDDVRVGASPTGGIYLVPGWPIQKPLAVNWSHRPRNYPPGDLLLFAPAALLYHYTSIPAWWANRVALFLCILFAHMAFYFFVRLYLDRPDEHGPVTLVTLFVIYGICMFWTLQGFYDLAAVPPLILCGKYLAQRRGIDALLAYCVAAVIHFRVYFLAPLFLCAAWITIKNRQWLTWSRRDWQKLGIAAVLAGASLFPFFMVWPWVSHAKANNMVNIWEPAVKYPVVCVMAAVWVCAALGFIWSGAWLDLGILMWLGLTISTLHEALQWHVLVPIAWLGVPIILPESAGATRAVVVRDFRLIVLLAAALGIFRNQFVFI
jgi:hypothetical protein